MRRACTICGKPIILAPSARERAAKWGGKPSDYTRLSLDHAECAIAKARREHFRTNAKAFVMLLIYIAILWIIVYWTSDGGW